MIDLERLLAPGRALDALVRRVARGDHAAWRLLTGHAPGVIDAETRWLHPALLRRLPGSPAHAHLLPFGGDHEHVLEWLERLSASRCGGTSPMFRGLQWLMLGHGRAERRWVERAWRQAGPALHADPALQRFVDRCQPLVEAVAATSAEPRVPARAGTPRRPATARADRD